MDLSNWILGIFTWLSPGKDGSRSHLIYQMDLYSLGPDLWMDALKYAILLLHQKLIILDYSHMQFIDWFDWTLTRHLWRKAESSTEGRKVSWVPFRYCQEGCCRISWTSTDFGGEVHGFKVRWNRNQKYLGSFFFWLFFSLKYIGKNSSLDSLLDAHVLLLVAIGSITAVRNMCSPLCTYWHLSYLLFIVNRVSCMVAGEEDVHASAIVCLGYPLKVVT